MGTANSRTLDWSKLQGETGLHKSLKVKCQLKQNTQILSLRSGNTTQRFVIPKHLANENNNKSPANEVTHIELEFTQTQSGLWEMKEQKHRQLDNENERRNHVAAENEDFKRAMKAATEKTFGEHSVLGEVSRTTQPNTAKNPDTDGKPNQSDDQPNNDNKPDNNANQNNEDLNRAQQQPRRNTPPSALETHIYNNPADIGAIKNCLPHASSTSHLKILGDGKCGARAAWLAILINGDHEHLLERLQGLDLSPTLLLRVAASLESAQDNIGNVLAFAQGEPSYETALHNAQSGCRIRYPDEGITATVTQAEQDLQQIFLTALRAAGVNETRLNQLKSNHHANSEELATFAKMLGQELIVSSRNQLEVTSQSGSLLHRFTCGEDSEKREISRAAMGNLNHPLQNICILEHRNEHFNLAVGAKALAQLETYHYGQADSPIDENVVQPFMQDNEPVYSFYSSSIAQEALDKTVENSHQALDFSDPSNRARGAILANWIHLLGSANQTSISQAIDQTGIPQEECEELKNLLNTLSASLQAGNLRAIAKPTSAAAANQAKGRAHYIVSPGHPEFVNFSGCTQTETALLKLTEKVLALPQVAKQVSIAANYSSVGGSDNPLTNEVIGHYETTRRDKMAGDQPRIKDPLNDERKVQAVCLALNDFFKVATRLRFAFDGQLHASNADAERQATTEGLIISNQGITQPYFDQLIKPLARSSSCVSLRGSNPLSPALVASHLADKTIVEQRNVISRLWLPKNEQALGELAQIDSTNSVLFSTYPEDERFQLYHSAYEFRRLGAELVQPENSSNPMRTVSTEILRSDQPLLMFKALTKLSHWAGQQAENSLQIPSFPEIREVAQISDEDHDVYRAALDAAQTIKHLIDLPFNEGIEAGQLEAADLGALQAKAKQQLWDLATEKQNIINLATRLAGQTESANYSELVNAISAHAQHRLQAIITISQLEFNADPENWYNNVFNEEDGFVVLSDFLSVQGALQLLSNPNSSLFSPEPIFDDAQFISAEMANRTGLPNLKKLEDILSS